MDSDEHDCALNGGSDGCNDARCTFDSPAQPARKGNSAPLAQVAQPDCMHILGASRAARLYRLRLGQVEWCVHSTTCEGCVLGSMALAVLHAQNVVLGSLTLHRPSHRVRCEGCMANTRRSAEPLQLLGNFSDSGSISAGVHCPECAVCQFANDRHGQTAQLGLRAGTAEQPHREWQSVRRRAVHWLSNCRVQYDSVCINCLAGTCILEVGLRVRTDCPAG